MIREIRDFMGEYRLTKMKKMTTRDGLAWSGVIIRNGKEIGSCEDQGRGGEVMIFIQDKSERELLDKTAKEKIKEKHEATGLYLAAVADYEESIKRFRTATKTKTFYRLSDDTETDSNGVHTTYRASKTPFSDSVRDAIKKQFGTKLVEIINDELDAFPVVSASKKKKAAP